jgi:hypothetical protein
MSSTETIPTPYNEEHGKNNHQQPAGKVGWNIDLSGKTIVVTGGNRVSGMLECIVM